MATSNPTSLGFRVVLLINITNMNSPCATVEAEEFWGVWVWDKQALPAYGCVKTCCANPKP